MDGIRCEKVLLSFNHFHTQYTSVKNRIAATSTAFCDSSRGRKFISPLLFTVSRQCMERRLTMYSVVHVCVSVCSHFSYARYLKNQFMNLCKIYSKHCLHTTLEMINVWYISHARWLTFSHFSFFHTIDCVVNCMYVAFSSYSPGSDTATMSSDEPAIWVFL